MPRPNVAILFGGRSVEHEISIVTAREVLGSIDRQQYAPVPVYVNREGRWFCGKRLNEVLNNDERKAFAKEHVRTSLERFLDEVTLLPIPGIGGLMKVGAICGQTRLARAAKAARNSQPLIPIDVFLPVFHGTFGEDGCMQGLFELAEVAYTGCNTVASAIGMHKHFAKQLLEANGINCLPGILVRKREIKDFDRLWDRIGGKLPFPLFVKPCNLGSSVGITRQSIVESHETLAQALAHSFRYDEAAIIEPYLTNLKELQVAVCRRSSLAPNPNGGVGAASSRKTDLLVSAVETPKVHGVNTASEKYGDNMLSSGSKTAAEVGLSNAKRELNPKDVPESILAEVVAAAQSVYDILDCRGVVRVDFFYDTSRGKVLFNEINSLPGSLSLFLFHGLNPPVLFPELLSTLIGSALDTHARRDNYKRTHIF